MNFHTFSKLGKTVEWITVYLSSSFNNYQFMADLVLSLPPPPSHSSNPTLNFWELSKKLMESYPVTITTTHLPSRRLDFLITSQYEHSQSKKGWTHFPRHSVYMLRVFHQSYEREWHFQFKLRWLIKPEGWVIEDYDTFQSNLSFDCQHLYSHPAINLSPTLP